LYFENEENEEETSNTDNNGQVIDIPTSETNEIKIEVLNASGSKNKLNKVQKLLKEKGYNVKTNDVEVISKTTIINNTDVDGKYIEQIQELLGVGVLSSSATASNNTDVTIIIGKDYK
jgi:transcriptional/translational regulatory protein YebC/TACO1